MKGSLLLLIMLLSMSGCIFPSGVPLGRHPYKIGYEIGYHEYLENEEVRSEVDRDWIDGNRFLIRNGYKPEPHPYGDRMLSKKGVEKVEDHQYSTE